MIPEVHGSREAGIGAKHSYKFSVEDTKSLSLQTNFLKQNGTGIELSFLIAES